MKYLAVILCVLLTSTTTSSTQTWEPQLRMWGVFTTPLPWFQATQHPPLVNLRFFPTRSRDEFRDVYDLTTLSLVSVPYGDLHGLEYVGMKGDVNGNGHVDIVGADTTPSLKLAILLDAYTAQERLRVYKFDGKPTPGTWGDQGDLVDCDGDGINDVFAHIKNTARISFGDRDEPFVDQSEIKYHYDNNTTFTEGVCLGTLEGRAVMLRVAFKEIRNNETWVYYELDALNVEDLQARRDTIRTETLLSYRSPTGHRYRDMIITFDDVWHFTHYNGARTVLRVTLNSIEEFTPHESFADSRGVNFVLGNTYGQSKKYDDKVLRIKGDEVFLSDWFSRDPDGIKRRWIEMHIVVDRSTLETENLGIMNLADADNERDRGGMQATCTVPDLDNDGIDDALIYYLAVDSIDQESRLTDLFLTTGRPTVGVSQSGEESEELDACAVATRTPKGWSITCSTPLQVGCLGGTRQALIYDALGRLVETLPLEITGAIHLSDPGTLPSVPLWAVLGDCAVRLQ